MTCYRVHRAESKRLQKARARDRQRLYRSTSYAEPQPRPEAILAM